MKAHSQGTIPTCAQETVAKKYGWDDVFAGKPVGVSWPEGGWLDGGWLHVHHRMQMCITWQVMNAVPDVYDMLSSCYHPWYQLLPVSHVWSGYHYTPG